MTLSPERELFNDAHKCSEIIQLLSNAQLLKIVINVGPEHQQLVKKIIFNISSGFYNAESKEYMKVHVIVFFMLSPAIINDFLGRGRVINVGFLLSLKTIFREITDNVHEE